MKKFSIVLLLVACGLAGCRQSDSPLPDAVQMKRTDDISDLGKDILNVQGGVAGSPKELTDDYVKFAPNETVEKPAQALNAELLAALPKAKFSPADATKLAEKLWQGVAATDISQKQQETMATEFKTLLMAGGIPEASAGSLTARLTDVQKAANHRQKRWYEVF